MAQTTARQQAPPIAQFLQQNIRNLSKFEKFFFENGSSFIAANSVVCGVMANNLFRSALNVQGGYLLSSLPITAFPFLCTALVYEGLITQPLIQGSLSCPVCAVVRSSCVGVCMGGVLPILMAGYINLKMAPEKGGILPRIISSTKPVFIRLKYFLLFEAVTSVFITSKQISTIEKLLLMPFSVDTEGLTK
uniref:Transmembrane protein 126A n=2 Tax=Pyxicephalus adspersus TaxID=30357 RepID=A0AAV3ARA5_PYXAD|nr:TPA: hypothetical protein GDO54_008035 [Pyxicephalus adspersus]